MTRLWPQFFVEACQEFAIMHDYSQVRVVRSHRSYSWKRPNTYCDPDTTEDIREQQRIRLRLIRRLDGTAGALGFEQQKKWWIWKAKKQRKEGRAGWGIAGSGVRRAGLFRQ
jgi:hypothetical protein